MSRLAGIIRLRKWELDQLRRTLADLERERDRIIAAADALKTEMQQEIAAEREGVAGMTLGPYLDGARRQLEIYEEVRAVKQQEIDIEAEKVRDAFRALKTFEIADERAKAHAMAEEKRREQTELDDIAGRMQ